MTNNIPKHHMAFVSKEIAITIDQIKQSLLSSADSVKTARVCLGDVTTALKSLDDTTQVIDSILRIQHKPRMLNTYTIDTALQTCEFIDKNLPIRNWVISEAFGGALNAYLDTILKANEALIESGEDRLIFTIRSILAETIYQLATLIARHITCVGMPDFPRIVISDELEDYLKELPPDMRGKVSKYVIKPHFPAPDVQLTSQQYPMPVQPPINWAERRNAQMAQQAELLQRMQQQHLNPSPAHPYLSIPNYDNVKGEWERRQAEFMKQQQLIREQQQAMMLAAQAREVANGVQRGFTANTQPVDDSGFSGHSHKNP